MGRMQRSKGARGEREFAAEFNKLFHTEAHRGRQYHGGPDSPDVVIPGVPIHPEVKRTEKLSLYAAMEQAVEDAGEDVPIVGHKRNGKPWLAVVRLDDLPRLVEVLYQTLYSGDKY